MKLPRADTARFGSASLPARLAARSVRQRVYRSIRGQSQVRTPSLRRAPTRPREAQADAADRRNLRLLLTDEGKAVQETFQRRRRKLAQVAAAGFSDAERQQLLALLARVHENIAKASES